MAGTTHPLPHASSGNSSFIVPMAEGVCSSMLQLALGSLIQLCPLLVPASHQLHG